MPERFLPSVLAARLGIPNRASRAIIALALGGPAVGARALRGTGVKSRRGARWIGGELGEAGDVGSSSTAWIKANPTLEAFFEPWARGVRWGAMIGLALLAAVAASAAPAPVTAAAAGLFERDWVLANWALKKFDADRDILLSPGGSGGGGGGVSQYCRQRWRRARDPGGISRRAGVYPRAVLSVRKLCVSWRGRRPSRWRGRRSAACRTDSPG